MAGKDAWTVPLPVRRVERSPYAALPDDEWPLTIPAVARVVHRDVADAAVRR
ncbi:hypothetical protein [Knoellia koreensis]|uniref:hypothetical protein n=1 Tax=Knoellia koreensis TaxID=2730921 RepID=UPI001F0DE776|nr:hypothetical protein [Knoellia sp. DB2414S]